MKCNTEKMELIKTFASSIRKLYDFSLIPTDKNYKLVDEIAERMEGGIIKEGYETEVARCGKGFIIKIPKIRTDSSCIFYDSRIDYFALGLAILFIKMCYTDKEKFNSFQNMEFYGYEGVDFDTLLAIKYELILPEERLREEIAKHSKDGMFCIDEIANDLKLPKDLVTIRLSQCRYK